MIVRFGLSLQEQIFPLWEEGIDYSCGPQQLIEFLEEQLGIGYPDNKAFLRVEQYRQLLALYLEKIKRPFLPPLSPQTHSLQPKPCSIAEMNSISLAGILLSEPKCLAACVRWPN